ncbi:MAG: hypothetical protein AAGM38_16165 [Pseudomonadota bacterium]
MARDDAGLTLIGSARGLSAERQRADAANTRRNAAALSESLIALGADRIDRQAAKATALLIRRLWGSVMRLGAEQDHDPAEAALEHFTRMLERRLKARLSAAP